MNNESKIQKIDFFLCRRSCCPLWLLASWSCENAYRLECGHVLGRHGNWLLACCYMEAGNRQTWGKLGGSCFIDYPFIFFISVFLCNHLNLLASSYVFKFRVFTCLYLCFKVLFKNLSSIGQLFFYYPKGGNILNYNNQNILWEAQNKEKNKTVFNGYWLAC